MRFLRDLMKYEGQDELKDMLMDALSQMEDDEVTVDADYEEVDEMMYEGFEEETGMGDDEMSYDEMGDESFSDENEPKLDETLSESMKQYRTEFDRYMKSPKQ